MKKNKQEKEKNKRPKRIKRIILLIILLFILILSAYAIYSIFKDELKNNTIIAIKETIEDEQQQEIKYIIKIKNYEIESAIKEITFKSKQEAQSEYNRYEIINEYEERKLGLNQKGKKLKLLMPENELLQDIECSQDKIIVVTKNGEEKEIINQEELKKCLIEQGYKIEN